MQAEWKSIRKQGIAADFAVELCKDLDKYPKEIVWEQQGPWCRERKQARPDTVYPWSKISIFIHYSLTA